MDLREADRAVGERVDEEVWWPGVRPAIAKLATESAADFDTKPIQVEPKNEIERDRADHGREGHGMSDPVDVAGLWVSWLRRRLASKGRGEHARDVGGGCVA